MAHECPHPFHLAFGAFSLEGPLPSPTFCHLELLNLIVVGNCLDYFILAISLLLFVTVGAPLVLPFAPISCSGSGVIVFVRLVIEFVEKGRKDGVELVEDYVHVEAIKINDPPVNVFLVGALPTVFKEKLDEAVHQSQDLNSKRVVDCNSIFVDDAMLSINVHHKITKLGCKDAVFAKNKAYCCRECFQLEIE
jgi:hypothetical protein